MACSSRCRGLDGPALPPLLSIWLIRLDGGDDLAGHQINAAHSDLVGHQTLAAPEDHVRRVDDVDDALQLLDNGAGVPGDDLVGGMGLFVAEAGAAWRDVGGPHARLLTPALRGRPAHVPGGLQPVAGRGPTPTPPTPLERTPPLVRPIIY